MKQSHFKRIQFQFFQLEMHTDIMVSMRNWNMDIGHSALEMRVKKADPNIFFSRLKHIYVLFDNYRMLTLFFKFKKMHKDRKVIILITVIIWGSGELGFQCVAHMFLFTLIAY